MVTGVTVKHLGRSALHTRLFANLMLWVALAWGFTHLQLPGNTLFLNNLQNAGHGLAFALATWLAIKSCTYHQPSFSWPVAVFICILLSALGVFIELAQHATGRTASLPDLAMNSVGILGGLAASRIRFPSVLRVDGLECNRVPSGYNNQSLKHSLIWALVAIAAMAYCLQKPAWYLLAKSQIKPLPMLMDFEPWTSSALLRAANSTITLDDHSDVWAGNVSQSARVDFNKGRWPSIRFLEPVSDWRGFSSFTFKVFNPSSNEIPIRIRVDDASIDYPDHAFMSTSRQVPMGESTITVPFSEFALDARERGTARFDSMTGFLFFLSRIDAPMTLYFDDVQLTSMR